MYMDKTLNKSWWNHLDVTFNGKDPLQVSKLLRRVRMLANVGGVESTRSLRDLTEGLYKDFKIEPEVVSALKELREKNFNGIVLQDEVFTLGGRQMSLLKDAMDQIKKESDVNKDWLFDQIAENTNTGELEFNKTKDSSLTDSWLVIRPNKFDAFSAQYGSGGIKGVGALKPIIAKLGVNPLLGKTEMTKHEAFNGFFEKNPDVDFVLVKSGAKWTDPGFKFYENYKTLDDFLLKENLGS